MLFATGPGFNSIFPDNKIILLFILNAVEQLLLSLIFLKYLLLKLSCLNIFDSPPFLIASNTMDNR